LQPSSVIGGFVRYKPFLLSSLGVVYLAQSEKMKVTEIYSNNRVFDRVKGIKRVFE